MNLVGKRLLILGGVVLAKEIVKAAQKMGVYVIVTDYLEDSPAKKIANKSYMISTTDVDGVVSLIKHEKIDGILTGFVDSLLPYYNKICEKAKLPCYATHEQFEVATNKDKFKDCCRRFDIPVVEEYLIDYPFRKDSLKIIQYPVLIKPIDNSGARGIFICNDEIEFKENYLKSMSFSRSKKVIIEKYMSSKEVTIDYLFQDGEIMLSAMSDRHMKNKQTGIVPLPVGYTFPSIHLKRYQASLDHKVRNMFKTLGIKNGMIFIQSFVENGECVFYEMGYRFTGCLEYKIIDKMNKVNPLELMIHFALTGKMSEQRLRLLIDPNYNKYGFNLTFLAKPGRIEKIVGIEEVMSLKNIIDVVITHDVGEIITEDAIGTLKQVVIRVVGFADDKKQLVNTIEDIQSLIDVYSPSGESMLMEVLNANEL